MSTKGVEFLQKIEFKRHAEAEAKALHLKNLEANRPRTKIVISTLPSSREDWVLEKQAGVSFWVHQSTGEVSMICPYDQSKPSSACRRVGPALEEGEGEGEATGAMVYHRDEYEEYLQLLGGDDEEVLLGGDDEEVE